MIIWGSGGDNKDLGQVQTGRCETCVKDRSFKLVLNYRYAHLYYLFSWVTEKKYLLLCDVCHRGWELDSTKIEGELKENPIPFMHRYGWTFLVGLIVIIGIAAIFQ